MVRLALTLILATSGVVAATLAASSFQFVPIAAGLFVAAFLSAKLRIVE